MRRFVALALSFALQAAALGVPLVHAHPDDHATAHHEPGAVHTHWPGHNRTTAPSSGPVIDPEDHERAVFFGAFIAVAAAGQPAVGPAQPVFGLPVPLERAAHVNVDVAHGHDPPALGTLPPRAPPALPVLI